MASKQEYLRMMKRMDNESGMRPDEIEQTTKDVFSSEAIKPYEDEILGPPMPMSKFDEMLRDEMRKKLDPRSVVREGEEIVTQFTDQTPMSIEIDGKTMMMTPAEIAQLSEADQNRLKLSPTELRNSIMADDPMLKGLSLTEREAIEALTTMGISLEDALEAIRGVDSSTMTESAVGETMGGGALQALPMTRPTMKPESLDADRTQSLDMQKEAMGT